MEERTTRGGMDGGREGASDFFRIGHVFLPNLVPNRYILLFFRKRGCSRIDHNDLRRRRSLACFFVFFFRRQVLLRKVRDNASSHGHPRQTPGRVRGGFDMVSGLLLPGVCQLGVVLPLPLRAHDIGSGERPVEMRNINNKNSQLL